MSEETQTVADEAEAGASDQQEAGGAQEEKSLDALLAEWDDGTQQESEEKPKEQSEGKDSRMDEVLSYVNEQRKKEALESFNKGVQDAVSLAETETGDFYSKEELEDFLYAKAARDTRFQQLFIHRHSNQDAFNKAVKAAAKEWGSRAKSKASIDKEATEDREIVANAVRSASTKAAVDDLPNVSDLMNMSGADFEQAMSRLGK